MRDGNFISNDLYAANIELSLNKLATAAREVPKKKFFVVHSVPHRDDENPVVDENLVI